VAEAVKQSKYALKGGAYQYSAALRAWQRAKRVGNDREADEASRGHERQFNYRRNTHIERVIV
jgi:hypothetical protein